MSRLAAVIGHPVGHSLSPALFELLSERTGRRAFCFSMDVPPERLRRAFRSLRGSLAGINVTAPHKVRAWRLCDGLRPSARAIGAVNAVSFSRGRAVGHNTDAPAFLDALRGRRVPLKGRTAAVFGSGGAARAVCYALASAGVRRILILRRGRAGADALLRRLAPRFPRTRMRALAWKDLPRGLEASLWVNATPLGMRGAGGAPRRFPLPKADRRTTACDLVYRPRETPFLRQARRRGMRTVPGLDMFVVQALRSWEIFFGRLPSRRRHAEALRRRLQSILSEGG